MKLLMLPLALGLSLTSPGPVAAQPILAPPPPRHHQGFPVLQTGQQCAGLQNAITAAVAGQKSAWSISVLDDRGQLLADLKCTLVHC